VILAEWGFYIYYPMYHLTHLCLPAIDMLILNHPAISRYLGLD
jgi:hypothetical protein